jgi:glutathione S-transferase
VHQQARLALAAGEHKSKEIMELNPRGQVPTFKDGEIVVNESMAAMQYLEEAYPDPPLMPKDKPTRALALQRFHESAGLLAAVVPLFRAKMRNQVNTDAEKVCTSSDKPSTQRAPKCA